MIKLEIHLTRPSTSKRKRILLAAGAVALLFPVLAVAAPIDIPNQFTSGSLISAEEFNENFDALATSVNDNDTRLSAVEEAPAPQVTVRKATGGGTTSIAFCEADEVLTGGGCFFPPENRYDTDFADYDTYFTGNFPRPLVGLTSVPVPAGTPNADIRPQATTGARIIPFPGDIVAEDAGSVVAAPGGGWACRAGVIDHDNAGGAQAITTSLYESWYFHVKAYAVCMSVD